MCRPLLEFALLLIFAAAPLCTQAGSPVLTSVLPRSGQRGTEVEATFNGDRLTDAAEVIFYESGLSTVSLEATNASQVKVRLRIDSVARLGPHVLRLRTRSGISEARTFSVGPYPVVLEKEPNNDFSSPQPVLLNSTVQGIAGNEDIDYYQVQAKKGQRLTAEVEAMRLGSALVDCFVAIMDSKRFELASSDDSSLALQDPIASIIAPEDGAYIVAVRESSFAGNDDSRYCLHLGEAPRPMVVYPPGGKAGEELEIRLLGDVRGDVIQKVKLPDKAVDFYDYFLVQEGQSAPSPNRLRVSVFPNALESEPNDSSAHVTNNLGQLPLAFNGVIASAGDKDFFRFKANAGQKYDVRCVAREVRSPLDPVLAIYKTDGTSLAENDDSGGPDSLISWTVPADGDYIASVRDHLNTGGTNYVYRVEFSPVAAGLTLGIPEFARNSQERNTIAVPLGNRAATLIRVTRANFSGDVTVRATGLPEGVTLAADPIITSVTEVPVVFEAGTNSALGACLIPLIGEQTGSNGVTGGFTQNLELVYGEPNNTIYYKTSVDRLALAVTEEVPFKVQVVEPKVPLVQSGSLLLKVLVERKEGFKGAIKLRMLWNPPGVGSENEVTVPEGVSEASYPVNANGTAPVRTWRICIIANADAGRGPLWTSSQLAKLTIATPYVSMRIPMAAAEQGKSVPIVCNVEQLQPFEGSGQVQLYGLPPKVLVATNSLSITKDTKLLTFDATVAADAPVGQHKTLFCQVVLTNAGGPINHSVGSGGVLRIDAPPPAPKTNVAPTVATAPSSTNSSATVAKVETPLRPLSRLEKLRLEAKEKVK